LFAFVGPYLPLGRHFAIGNFIGDVLAGRPIAVTGDGTAMRTYLYAGDLAAWLWRILVAGEPARAYNVGGDRMYSIAQVAQAVSDAGGGASRVVVAGLPSTAGTLPERYVPETSRARTELDLVETVPLEVAISRTLAWHRALAARKLSS
jgi:nucleoside-diphosphate-sugar epimerase